MTREEQLQELNQRMRMHPVIQQHTRHGLPPRVGEGSLNPRILLLGDCSDPEDEVRDSVLRGPKAPIIRGIIKAIGADNVFYANSLFWRPIGKDNKDDRKPNKRELDVCRPFIDQLLDILRPQIIVTLGTTPLKSLLNLKQPLHQCVGQIHRYRGIPLFPIYDPEFLERQAVQRSSTKITKRDYWLYFLRVMRLVGLQPTEKQAHAYLPSASVFSCALWAEPYVEQMAEAAANVAVTQGRTLDEADFLRLKRTLGVALSRGFTAIKEEEPLVQALNTSVFTHPWPGRVRNLFLANGIETYKDLIRRPLRQISGLGPKTEKLIQAHLTDKGLSCNTLETIIYAKDSIY